MSTNKKHFSFEFFPPKTDAGLDKLLTVRDALAGKNPEFFSVTYGAGGSTREKTLNTVRAAGATGVKTAPHLSCIGERKEDILSLLNTYKDEGINRIVTLRGDLPEGSGSTGGDFTYASELLSFIKENFGNQFTLEVAAYPEIHPQAVSPQADLDNLKRKADAGANSAITQYFYNAEAYGDFVGRCEQIGITIPIYAGIMPITNYTNLARFSDRCGAEIPRWIRQRLEGYGDDLSSIKAFGEEVVSKLCEKILAEGAPGIHFYTMNQAESSLAIWDNLKLDDYR